MMGTENVLHNTGYHRRSGGDAREKARRVRRRLRQYRNIQNSDSIQGGGFCG